MTQDSFEPDRELSRLFEAERRADESAAPDLGALLARRPRRRISVGRRIAWALALASLVTLAILLVDVHKGAPRQVTPPAEVVQLADWESPTAFLLDNPGSELLTEIPNLASSPANENVSSPEPTKGVTR
ncbi:MAG TPA: hypothetical protein VGK26_10355 [Thermoanaerobaculia bacterium]